MEDDALVLPIVRQPVIFFMPIVTYLFGMNISFLKLYRHGLKSLVEWFCRLTNHPVRGLSTTSSRPDPDSC